MPQQQATKKKKGRAPAHQNAFAYKHNPKSKKTDAILNSPNNHVCRRCHDKIEWRKKYRKYKSRTQPGKCNLCLQRNVKAAYHTICTDCTTSDRARNGLLAKEVKENGTCAATAAVTQEASSSSSVEETDTVATVQEVSQAASKLTIDSKNDSSESKKNVCHRVCAMCTKEPALPDENDGESTAIEDLVGNRKLKLRERRTLERKLAKEQETATKNNQDNVVDKNVVVEQESENNDAANNDVNDSSNAEEEASETEDDLIKAVGGQDKLLTGEAYQKMLFEREKQEVSTAS